MQQSSLQQFKQKYVEEVNDMLNEMEGAILTLEQDPSNIDEINQVFRVMHTIKGTSAMYDFKTVEKITHDVESIYSKIRDTQGSVSKDVSTLTLECVDLLRQLLNQPSDDDERLVDDFLARVAAINGSNGNASQNAGSPNTGDKHPQKAIATYYVMFAPEADINNRGVNIKGILDSIQELGESTIFTRSWPDDLADNGKFYMYWEAVFATEMPFNELDEIFLFVHDETKIEKIADFNLFESNDFKEQLATYQLVESPIDTAELKAIAMTIQPEQPAQPSETPKPEQPAQAPVQLEQRQRNAETEKKIIAKSMMKSPWLYHINTGSCNGCDIELVACLTPRYDVERYGFKLAGTPRHADIVVVSGPITSQSKDRL
ncbi:MAG: Hpt domain-containing protein, partial [Bacteroidales bacterium]|nr:Hpt domain-containing protein [Bacteroidales bacterium]